TSMSLLSTRETRMSVMAREYARVVAHGLVALGSGGVRSVHGPRALRAGALLVASALPHLRTAMAGPVHDPIPPLPAPLPPGDPRAPSRASPARSRPRPRQSARRFSFAASATSPPTRGSTAGTHSWCTAIGGPWYARWSASWLQAENAMGTIASAAVPQRPA